jgi:Dolichyl-phosphate-mannose-protein mannosyltransferase
MHGSQHSSAAPSRFAWVLPIALGSVAAGCLLLRIASIAEPLGIDQSLWASAVRGMSRGQLLYRDVWEQRPPGIYLIYLLGFSVFGWASSTVAWLDILAAVATTGLLFAIVRRLSAATTGVVAGALYAALTMPAWLYQYGGFLERSVCETFIVVCVALGAWCAVRFRESDSNVAAAGVGLWVGAAIVLKPNAGLYLPALLLWMAVYRRRRERAFPLRPIVLAAVSAAIVPALITFWLWSIGVLDEARIAVVDFNRFYVGEGFTLGGQSLAFSKAVWFRMKTDALWLAGGVAALVAMWEFVRTRRLPPVAGLAVFWGGAAALVIFANGIRLYNAYFIQAFAPLAVLAAWLLAEAARGSLLRRLIGVATMTLMIVVLLERHYPARIVESARVDFDRLAGRSTPAAYLDGFGSYANNRGYSARANAELADYVRAHTSPDDRIFLFGISGAGVYFNADRLTAHRFLRVNFFVPAEFPDPRFRLERVVDDLAVSRPMYLIFEKLHSSSDAEMGKAVDALLEHPDIARLLQDYRRETQIEDFTLYRRIH